MTLKEIKKELLEWTDFYGQDIVDKEAIKKCKTKNDCYEILRSHRFYQQNQNIDAGTDLDQFVKKLGL